MTCGVIWNQRPKTRRSTFICLFGTPNRNTRTVSVNEGFNCTSAHRLKYTIYLFVLVGQIFRIPARFLESRFSEVLVCKQIFCIVINAINIIINK